MVAEAASAWIVPQFQRHRAGVFGTLDIALDNVEPCLAGPSRPQDGRRSTASGRVFTVLTVPGRLARLDAVLDDPRHGRLAIAAITACTNTSNPALMIGAGLLARNAAAAGLRPPSYVKTSLAPGSRVVLDYLGGAGLIEGLEALGFFAVGFGCTTCSGKSGPIDAELERLARDEGVVLAAILSGNRNFEGRIHKSVRAAYLGHDECARWPCRIATFFTARRRPCITSRSTWRPARSCP